jgi:hypothetical protein
MTPEPEPESVPEAAPAVDGPFVEVRPGVWVRAASVDVVEGVAVDSTNKSRVHVRTDATYLSPWPGSALRAALRRAEHAEGLRVLELAARLAALHR